MVGHSTQDDVDRTAAAMPTMSGPDGDDSTGVGRCGDPVRKLGPDATPGTRLMAHVRATIAPGDDQQHPSAARHHGRQCGIEPSPCGVQPQAVQVEHPVRLHQAAREPPLPPTVELGRARCARHRRKRSGEWRRWTARDIRWGHRCPGLTERRHGARDGSPQSPVAIVQLTARHGANAPRPHGAGAARRRLSLTSRRRSPAPRRQPPRRCQSGWHP